MSTAKRFLVIANPIAGGGRGAIVAPQLRDALESRACEVELYLTRCAGDGAARAKAVTPGQFDGVVTVGGDGTLHEVLGGLADPTIPLGILAMGTANVMALELGLPRRPDDLAGILAAGKTIRTALGVANDRRFLLFASSGLDAAIVERVATVRTGTQGKLKYVPTILHVGRRWPMKSIGFTTAEGEHHSDLSTVIVTRVAGYAGILRFPGTFDLGDGLLHVVGFRQRTRWQYARAFARSMAGRLRAGRDVLCVATRGVRIESEGAPWQIDGELGGHGPVDIHLDSREARLFVP